MIIVEIPSALHARKMAGLPVYVHWYPYRNSGRWGYMILQAPSDTMTVY